MQFSGDVHVVGWYLIFEIRRIDAVVLLEDGGECELEMPESDGRKDVQQLTD